MKAMRAAGAALGLCVTCERGARHKLHQYHARSHRNRTKSVPATLSFPVLVCGEWRLARYPLPSFGPEALSGEYANRVAVARITALVSVAADGQLYLVMEVCVSGDPDSRMDRCPLDRLRRKALNATVEAPP